MLQDSFACQYADYSANQARDIEINTNKQSCYNLINRLSPIVITLNLLTYHNALFVLKEC